MRTHVPSALAAGLLLVAMGCGDNVDVNVTVNDSGPKRDGGDGVRDAAVGGVDAMKPTADAAMNPADAAVIAADAAIDAAIPDAAADAAIDAAIPDAAPDAAIDAAIPDAAVFEEPAYAFLSETGLYDDIAGKVLAQDVIEFEPEFKLWADGADKVRWIRLPAGQTVDTGDMDHWRFPIGTQIWKEFSHQVDGATVLLETRLTEVWGPEDTDIYQATFVWNADDSDAAFSRFGATNIKGTSHDAPAQDLCVRCHRGETDRILGFQAVQLSHDGPANIDDWATAGVFSDMPAPGGYPVPGDATERAAIGYLHANCGHCHNDSNAAVRSSACYALPTLQLWVKTTDAMVVDTYAYLMAVDQDLQYWVSPAEGNEGGFTKRIVSGDPTSSAIHYRMRVREAGQAPPFDDAQQMPPSFTDEVDAVGLAAVEAWILTL